MEELRDLWLGVNEDASLDHSEQSGDDLMKMRLGKKTLPLPGASTAVAA